MGHVVRMTATGAFGITFVFLVDAANLFWVSQLGDQTLVAAIGFAYAIQFFSVSSGIGLMIAATALVSRLIGEDKLEDARRQAGVSMIIAAITQGSVAALIVLWREPLVALAGAQGETAALSARYLAITMPSLVPMAIALVGSGVLRAYGFGAKAMYVTLFSGLLLMVLDPILIFWMQLGLDGAAIGLVLFRFLLVALAWYFVRIQNNLVTRPNASDLPKFSGVYVWLALPAIATQMATPVGNYILTILMAPFGDDAVAAWAVVSRLTVLAFGGIFALSGAIGGIFGQNFGAGNFQRIRSTFRDALVFCLVYTLVMWAVLASATSLIIQGFGLSPQGAEVVSAFTSVGVGGFVFVGALFVSNAAFNNLGRPLWSTVANWTKEAAISFPAAMWLSGAFGAAGVIYGQAAAAVLVGGLAALWAWRYVANLGPSSAVHPPQTPSPSWDRFRRR